jgi:hypothetical protein
MNSPGEFNSQLASLTAMLSSMVAERLAHWSRDMEPRQRQQILDMIENNLPNVIANTIAKTPSLHSASGVQYLEEHLDDWADTWAKKFIGKD